MISPRPLPWGRGGVSCHLDADRVWENQRVHRESEPAHPPVQTSDAAMNLYQCRFRKVVCLALLSVLLLGFLGSPVAPQALGQETASRVPSLVQSTNPSASPSPTPILAGW